MGDFKRKVMVLKKYPINGQKVSDVYPGKGGKQLPGHQVCCKCGKEFTRFNPNTGQTDVFDYYVVVFESGVKVACCPDRKLCSYRQRNHRKKRRKLERRML